MSAAAHRFGSCASWKTLVPRHPLRTVGPIYQFRRATLQDRPAPPRTDLDDDRIDVTPAEREQNRDPLARLRTVRGHQVASVPPAEGDSGDSSVRT